MLAPVHARSNAPRESVVGRPIFAFAQSAWVRNAVAAMNRSGRIAEKQKRPIATTSGHERRPLRRCRLFGGRAAVSAVVTSALLFSGQHPDLEEADHEDD